MMNDMPTVEAENPQCPEDDADADAVAHAHAQRVEPTTMMFLSPEQRRRKSIMAITLVLIITMVVIIVVVTFFHPNLKSAEESQQLPETTTANSSSGSLLGLPPVISSGKENDPLDDQSSTADSLSTITCPPSSTKSSDQQFLLEGFQSAGCHRMECLSSDHTTTTLHNTNTNTRDRLSHSAPLCQGQALCNEDDEQFPGVLFQFGLTENGALVWQKCDPVDPSRTEIITLWEASEEHHHELHTNTKATPPSSAVVASSQNQLWFEMRPDATWQILSTTGHKKNFATITTKTSSTTATATQLVFEQLVQHQPRTVRVTPKCLNDRPVMDCPYLHFRRHGDIVMNYIDTQDGWVACKSHKICYASLWE